MSIAAPTPGTARGASTAWNISLWVVQLLLAAAFGLAGIMKLTTPIPELAQTMAWAGDIAPALVRFIGAAELAGAVGLVLPAATRIRPLLTPLAAMGLATIMVLAAVLHVTRAEFGALPINAVLGALAAFVAWGRIRKAPIHPRRGVSSTSG